MESLTNEAWVFLVFEFLFHLLPIFPLILQIEEVEQVVDSDASCFSGSAGCVTGSAAAFS